MDRIQNHQACKAKPAQRKTIAKQDTTQLGQCAFTTSSSQHHSQLDRNDTAPMELGVLLDHW